MELGPVEILFQTLDETSNLLQKELDCTYLEALAETGENIFQAKILQEDELSEITLKRLRKTYQEVNRLSYNSEDIRKAFQLACLKGMRENVQPNHQMTPDSVGLLISYLIGKFMKGIHTFSVLDPAVGTGNLLTTLLNQLNLPTIKASGIEVDDLLIKLAYVNANLQQQPLELFNQDSLRPLYIDPVDCIVCDLPVGYYPDDIIANDYFLKADKGHSYAHHLFIEQSTNYIKDGGYLFFLIPNGLFSSPEAEKLHTFIKNNHFMQAIIQLPESMFKSKDAAKSILILQKQNADLKPPKEVLLSILPSMKDPKAMESLLIKMDAWFKENK
jgi:site-specific DNA-methyltransferase (adenine-specific)